MKVLAVLIGVVIMLGACSASRHHYGNYFNKWRYWGPMFTLNADSTFSYVHRANAGTVTIAEETSTGVITTTTNNYIFYDSSYGRFSLQGDTLDLEYHTRTLRGEFNGYNIRPDRLLWVGRKLFYFYRGSNMPLRQKEQYMQWSKHKIANVYRLDENYIAPGN